MNQYLANVFVLSLYSIPQALVGVAMLAFGFYVLFQNVRGLLNQALFFFSFNVFAWIFSFAVLYSIQNIDLANMWFGYFAFWGYVFLAPSGYLFMSVINNNYKQLWNKVYIFSSFGICFLYYYIENFTDYSFYELKHFFWGWYPTFSSWYILGFFLLSGILFVSIFISISKYIREMGIEIPISYKYLPMSLGMLITVDILPSINISVYPGGYIVFFLFSILTIYMAFKYKTLSITPAVAVDLIIDSMGDLLVVVNSDNKIVYVNKTASWILGYDDFELVGKSFDEVCDDKSLLNKAYLTKQYDYDFISNLEVNYLTKGGKKMPFCLNASLIRGIGGLDLKVIYVAKDMEDIYSVVKKLEKISLFLEKTKQLIKENLIKLRERNHQIVLAEIEMITLKKEIENLKNL